MAIAQQRGPRQSSYSVRLFNTTTITPQEFKPPLEARPPSLALLHSLFLPPPPPPPFLGLCLVSGRLTLRGIKFLRTAGYGTGTKLKTWFLLLMASDPQAGVVLSATLSTCMCRCVHLSLRCITHFHLFDLRCHNIWTKGPDSSHIPPGANNLSWNTNRAVTPAERFFLLPPSSPGFPACCQCFLEKINWWKPQGLEWGRVVKARRRAASQLLHIVSASGSCTGLVSAPPPPRHPAAGSDGAAKDISSSLIITSLNVNPSSPLALSPRDPRSQRESMLTPSWTIQGGDSGIRPQRQPSATGGRQGAGALVPPRSDDTLICGRREGFAMIAAALFQGNKVVSARRQTARRGRGDIAPPAPLRSFSSDKLMPEFHPSPTRHRQGRDVIGAIWELPGGRPSLSDGSRRVQSDRSKKGRTGVGGVTKRGIA
ncbi:unnamed protein product [Pleuronectes platessa]|uniref:Uncharacterized protein n=1 Tax=Pleuronectes platessa TaxID=8262 RepID=A0A9N7TMX3_PLEPL|nr:unnamed protein product [Pleuronectes platessa]